MLPKISLFDELRKGGYEASLITTFNAYLPFYEEVVLRRLVSCGIRHNVLMMDAKQYAAVFHRGEFGFDIGEQPSPKTGDTET